MLAVNKLEKIYGKGDTAFKALHGVSFSLELGSNLAILGKSGSGKSTLMHLVAGLDRPTSGNVVIDGTDVWKLKGHALDKFRNETISFIFQSFYLQNENSVLENVMVPLEIRGEKNRKESAMRALESLELEDKATNKASDLSGGQKQRAVIARAIVGSPKVIFADEPTGNLDTKTGAKVEEILFKINKDTGATLITVTHDEELAKKFDNMIELKDGRIVNHKGNNIKV
jgi:putative ABC transport system ATP-binding protein